MVWAVPEWCSVLKEIEEREGAPLEGASFFCHRNVRPIREEMLRWGQQGAGAWHGKKILLTYNIIWYIILLQ